MAEIRFIIIAILLSSATLMLALSIVAWRRRKNAGRAAILLSVCLAAITIYAFGYAMELSSTMLTRVLLWVRVEHFGIQIIAPAWLLFALCMTGREKFFKLKWIVPLFIIPVIYWIFVNNDAWRYLVYNNPDLLTTGPFPTFTFEKGPIYIVAIAYLSLCLAISTVLFTRMLFKSPAPFRRQATIFFIGSLIPWIAMGLYISGNTPYNLDLTPISMSLSGIIFALGILEFRILETVPLARDLIFEGLSDGMLILDKRDQIVDSNAAAQAMLPKMPKASIGLSVSEALIEYPELIRLVKENSVEIVEMQINNDLATACYQSKLSPVTDKHKRVMGKILSLHDYTKAKRLLKELSDLATLDGLTEVYNRRHFDELVCREMDRASRYGGAHSLIILDLDHFKNVNDTFGHAAGDMAIKTVADICRGLIRTSDILGRLGGEEFVVYLPETGPEAAVQLAGRLRRAIEQHQIDYNDRAISITASFGVFGQDSSNDITLQQLFLYADQALYKAKERGRNRVCQYTSEGAGNFD